jgi:hypothetical protein
VSATNSIKPDRYFTHSINDDIWTFYLITEEEAMELDAIHNDIEEGFEGLTVIDAKSVYIVEGNTTMRATITHELYHVYMTYQHISSADLDPDQIEELNAEWLGAMLDKLVAQVNILCKKYNALAEAPKKE